MDDLLNIVSLPIEFAGEDRLFEHACARVEDGIIVFITFDRKFTIEMKELEPSRVRETYLAEASDEGINRGTTILAERNETDGRGLEFRRLDDSSERYAELPMLASFIDHGKRRDCSTYARMSDMALCVWRIGDDGRVRMGTLNGVELANGAKFYQLVRAELGADGIMSMRG